ncbi:MAG: hypothetical protein ACYSW8_30860 [Planctomycetota bacterium]|jgi:hypothetical protein
MKRKTMPFPIGEWNDPEPFRKKVIGEFDVRDAPGSEQPRMGGTCPEMLDAMIKDRDHYKELAMHWYEMWKKADEANRELIGGKK